MESEWIPHYGGECPIHWAKVGEYELKFTCGSLYTPRNMDAVKCFWDSDIIAWRLTNGWTPVIDERMPLELIAAKSAEWEYRNRNGEVNKACSSPWQHAFDDNNSPYDIVAVRLLKKAEKPAPQTLNIEEMLAAPARTSDAYLRFRSSQRGKEALAQIGKSQEPQFKPLGEDAINDIAAAALREHDNLWPRKA
jgi:hypothetical protein